MYILVSHKFVHIFTTYTCRYIFVSHTCVHVCMFYDYLVFLRPLEIFYDHLVYFIVIWYIFPRFGISYQEKSGNPDKNRPFKSCDLTFYFDPTACENICKNNRLHRRQDRLHMNTLYKNTSEVKVSMYVDYFIVAWCLSY
jgi:hypothetical protein